MLHNNGFNIKENVLSACALHQTGRSTQRDYAAAIIWIMMSVELVVCQWEVENTSCQCHLLTRETAEQEDGTHTHTHIHIDYLHQHNEQ